MVEDHATMAATNRPVRYLPLPSLPSRSTLTTALQGDINDNDTTIPLIHFSLSLSPCVSNEATSGMHRTEVEKYNDP